MIELSSKHGFALLRAWGTIMRGSAVTGETGLGDAVGEMRHGLTTALETGAQAHVPYMMSLLIDTYRQMGLVNDGLDTVSDALQLIDKTGEQNWEAEILRLKGELLLAEPAVDQAEAERCFKRALKLSGEQHARSLELRAASSLAHYWRTLGRHKDACDLLNRIHCWFTEGFDTADLKQSGALIQEMK